MTGDHNNPEYDRVSADRSFKTAIRNSKILPMMLKSNIDELKDRTLDEILGCLNVSADGRTIIGRETEFADPKEGTVRMDTVFEVNIPGSEETISVLVNIEGQNNPRPGYPLGKRAEYYLARLVSSQKGTFFKGDDYGRMCKTYSIWYVLDPMAEDRNTVTSYSMTPQNVYGRDRKMRILNTYNIIFVDVGGYDSSLPDPMAFPSILFKLPTDARNSLMKDRFNIEVDSLLSRELDEMASLTQDTFDKGTDYGIEKSLLEMVQFLMDREGWTLEKALSLTTAPEYIKESVRKKITEQSS